MPTFYVSPFLESEKDANDKPLGPKLNDPPRTYRDLYAQDLYEQYKTAKGRKEFAKRRRKLEADLAELETLLNDPKRDRERVMSLSFGLNGLIVQQEDIPLLIKIIRTARTMRGPGSNNAETYTSEVLIQIADEDTLPFWVESFRFARARDGFAKKRRQYALRGAAVMALLHHNEQAIDLLIEGINHKNVKTREDTFRAVSEVKEIVKRPMPPRLTEALSDALR